MVEVLQFLKIEISCKCIHQELLLEMRAYPLLWRFLTRALPTFPKPMTPIRLSFRARLDCSRPRRWIGWIFSNHGLALKAYSRWASLPYSKFPYSCMFLAAVIVSIGQKIHCWIHLKMSYIKRTLAWDFWPVVFHQESPHGSLISPYLPKNTRLNFFFSC